MRGPVKKIVIVGGGSAGWMTAAALAKMSVGMTYTIDLVESEEIGTVGVGEATIPPIQQFNQTMGINEAEFMRATQASIKLGIQFVDWSYLGSEYLHPFGFYGVQMHGIYFHHFWLRHRAQGGTLHQDQFSQSAMAARGGRMGRVRPDDRLALPLMNYAYHFDAGLYSTYLRGIAEKHGVNRIEGRIADVKLDGEGGFIEEVILHDGRAVAGDFFIDCSGFRGLLIEQVLHAGYEDWREWLPCDRAVAMPCERVAKTTPYTRSTAREAGWQWRIPLQHRTGNGYVYCSEFLADDEAASLLSSRLDGAARAAPRLLRFVAGRRKEVWKKNCVAIGLSSGFLEPLESTSLHLIQSMIARLLFFFPGDGIEPATVARFNRLARDELEDIRDFLVLHYTATAREDTAFWRHCRAIRKPESLLERWQMYERNGNILVMADDLFKETSWFAVFEGQGVKANGYHPFANIPDDAELARRLDILRREVQQRVASYPTHDEFLRETCGALAQPAPMP